MCTMISTFWGVRIRLKFKVPPRLCLERNNEFLTCSNPSQCGMSLSTSLSVSLFLSVTTYHETKNNYCRSSCEWALIFNTKGIFPINVILFPNIGLYQCDRQRFLFHCEIFLGYFSSCKFSIHPGWEF